MAIMNAGPSERERQARRVQIASRFVPKAEALLGVAAQLVEDAQKLKSSVQQGPLLETLRSIKEHLAEARELIKGSSSIVKEYDLPQDLAYINNVVTSVLRVNGEIPRLQLAAELKEIRRRTIALRNVIAILHDSVLDIGGQQQPPGQYSVEGESPRDAEIEPYDLDNAPDNILDYDQAGLDQFSEYDMQMPGPGSNELVKVLELPVIATFNRSTSIEELNRRGFDCVNLAGYIILRKVYILGINKALCAAEKWSVEKVLETTLRKIGDNLNEQMALVCEQGIPYDKGGWHYYWIGPASYHRALGGRIDTRLTVSDFKFPFGQRTR